MLKRKAKTKKRRTSMKRRAGKRKSACTCRSKRKARR